MIYPIQKIHTGTVTMCLCPIDLLGTCYDHLMTTLIRSFEKCMVHAQYMSVHMSTHLSVCTCSFWISLSCLAVRVWSRLDSLLPDSMSAACVRACIRSEMLLTLTEMMPNQLLKYIFYELKIQHSIFKCVMCMCA